MNEGSKRDVYAGIRGRIDRLLVGEDDWIAALATVACELHSAFAHFAWTGFYRVVRPELLVIGPYQGSHGCLRIPFSRGVCGAAARTRVTQRVADVAQFAGHIACSAETRSEVVVPVLGSSDQTIAVLDVDATTLAAFDDVDQAELEAICHDLGRRFPAGELGR